MSRLPLFLLIALALFLSETPAMALSTVSGSDVMGTSPSNFADPDEQTPAFLTSPSETSLGMTPNTSAARSTVDINQTQNMEQSLGLSQAFDQAYSKK